MYVGQVENKNRAVSSAQRKNHIDRRKCQKEKDGKKERR